MIHFGRQFGSISRFERFLLFEPIIVFNAALFIVGGKLAMFASIGIGQVNYGNMSKLYC